MSAKLAIMASLAVVFGATSYYAGNEYLDSQSRARLSEIENGNNSAKLAVTSIVVTKRPLHFGEKIVEEDLKLVPWPSNALPDGAFTSFKEVIGNGERKAIKSIEKNEPLLVVKLTGEDGRAGLAGIIADGMRAVTIPVDHVKGVGGFVMPGDRVDIVFSQRDRKTGQQTANIILEKVKVLSVDQSADTRTDAPKVAKTVTLETDAEGAQKLALAGDVGTLSLLLRGAGDEAATGSNQISFGNSTTQPSNEADGPLIPDDGGSLFDLDKARTNQTTIKVVRGEEVKEESVPTLKSIQENKS